MILRVNRELVSTSFGGTERMARREKDVVEGENDVLPHSLRLRLRLRRRPVP